MDIARIAPSKTRKTFVAAAFGAALIVVLLGTVWRTSASAATAVERQSVWTERVKRGDMLRQVPVQGTLVPERVQWLSAVTAARVAHIEVRPGAAVEPDTVVLILENAELDLAALEAERQAASADAALIALDVRTHAEQKLQESSLASLHADLRDAQRRAGAAERLAPEGLMSDLDHGDAVNKVMGLTARVETEESRHEVLSTGRVRQLAAQHAEVARLQEIARFRRKQLAALQVRAGIRGIVQDIPLENGQWVAIGTLLAKVAEPDRLKAEVRVGEGNAKDVTKGLGVRFEGPAGAYRGHVERVDPAVVGGSVRLEVVLDDPLPKGARADQTVSGFVEIERLTNVLFAPRPAGAQDGSMAGIYRLDRDGAHASRVTARFGRGSAREIEIVGGLEEGDEIVVSDSTAFESSSKIRLK